MALQENRKIIVKCCGVCPYNMYVQALIIGTEFAEKCELTGKYIDDPNIIDGSCELEKDESKMRPT